MNLTDSHFFSESPIAIYTCNRQGLITAYNRAAAQLWGREPVLGHDSWCGAWRAYNLDGSPVNKGQGALFTALTTMHADEQEMIIERPDGTRKRVRIYARLITDGTAITGASAHLVEETYKEEREARHTVLSGIVESSDDAIISKDLNGIITSWNNGARQIFGFTEAEVLGQSITILIPQDRLNEEIHILGQIRAGQKVDHFQTVRLSKSGEEIHVSLSISPVRDSTGRIIGASKIARDITKQVMAEKAIRLYASNLEAINSIGNSIARKLEVSKIMQYVVDASTELTEATFGAFFYKSFNEDGEPVILRAFAGAPKSLDRTNELPLPVADVGNRFPELRGRDTASYLQVPVVSSDDEVVGELLFEHPLPGKFNSRHEELVASIAAQAAIALDNSKMFEEVNALSRKKDEFIALASHELKTPLTSVGGFLQIVAKKITDPVTRKFIDKAINQVAKLNLLVTDLLDAARLENTRLPLHMETFDCRQLVMDIIDDFRHAHPANTIRFNEGIEEVAVTADKQRIEQVLVNLLDNAIKYSPGSYPIFIRLTNRHKHVTITIKDKGIGMDERQQKGLFTRFYRVQNGAANIPGLGLGLYLSKQVIDQHGGQLTCRSALGRGSEFTVTIPKVQQPELPFS